MSRCNPEKNPASTQMLNGQNASGGHTGHGGHGHSHEIPQGMVEEGGFEVNSFPGLNITHQFPGSSERVPGSSGHFFARHL